MRTVPLTPTRYRLASLMIIEKTEGRMAEDHFWIKVEYPMIELYNSDQRLQNRSQHNQ